MNRQKLKHQSTELDRVADSTAEKISRFRDRADIFREHAAHDIRIALDFFEELLLDTRLKSEPRMPHSGTTQTGRAVHRVENIKSHNGYGFGCDICHGGFECRTYMTLFIGSYKGRLCLDLCEPCTKRLASTVDARLEDRRRR